MNRRNFLKVAATTSLLSNFGLESYGNEIKDKSIIYLHLGGGASQYETISPNPEQQMEYRSVTGYCDTNVNGIQLGGNYTKLATISDKLTIVKGFSHKDSSHNSATHLTQTGFVRVDRSDDAPSDFPSRGSVASALIGCNGPNGLPTYVSAGRIYSDNSAWLPKSCNPYESSGESINNLNIRVDKDRYGNRKELFQLMKTGNIIDRSGNTKAWDSFQEQVYGLLDGEAKKAFNTELESPETKLKYGNTSIGKQLLLARRLVESGSKFISCTFGGFDVHTNIVNQHNQIDRELDTALYALISELYERGLQENVLLIISTEFGRTSYVASQSPGGGRNHWGNMTPLIISGGNFEHGKIIGQTDKKATEVIGGKVNPGDINATVFKHLNLPVEALLVDNSGRPRYLIPENSFSIL